MLFSCQMLQYDYAMEVSQDSKLDSVTVSAEASHPLLKGGMALTAILETIYAFGSTTARDDAILDPMERKRKRNILRHLPAVDFTCGVQHIFIPPESNSYSDDGQTLLVPELEGGRMMINFLGGIDKIPAGEYDDGDDVDDDLPAVSEGVLVVSDFEVALFNLRTEGAVKEFPELEVFDGTMFRTNQSGSINGRIKSHLRPQAATTVKMDMAGPNIFNPLEAYEIDFSGTNLSVKMREYSAVLGHRRIILPAETAFVVSVIESVVDMGFEGKTLCELGWDFQGLSPILQVAPVGESPEDTLPENKQQVSVLIGPLRQGRFSLQVSSVGGIEVKKAATSRDQKEGKTHERRICDVIGFPCFSKAFVLGLYDWKFFNALVSPDESSVQRIFDVLHDHRTMQKCLQVVKLISEELHGILKYLLQQVWRAKEILDAEGVSDPGHAVPMYVLRNEIERELNEIANMSNFHSCFRYKMTRLLSLFLTEDTKEVDTIFPLFRRVIEGDGLDVVAVKDILRRYLTNFDVSSLHTFVFPGCFLTFSCFFRTGRLYWTVRYVGWRL